MKNLVTGYGYEKRKHHVEIKAEVTAEDMPTERAHYYCKFQQGCQKPDRISERAGQVCVSCARPAILNTRAFIGHLAAAEPELHRLPSSAAAELVLHHSPSSAAAELVLHRSPSSAAAELVLHHSPS